MHGTDLDALSSTLDELAGFVAGDRTLQETLQVVADFGADAVEGTHMTGLTLLNGERPTTAVFTDPTAVEIDAAQYESGTGPCLDASRQQRVFRIDSTRDDERWVEFSRAAAAVGISSVMSLPLGIGERGIGALNFYSRVEGNFTHEHEEVGKLFSGQAAVALANASAYWGATELAQQLEQALESRATIDQAKGIIMGAKGGSPEEAFEVLVRASQRENVKLREIARRVVEQAQRRTTK